MSDTYLSPTGVYESIRGFRGAQLPAEMGMGFWQAKQFRAYREFTANTTLKIVAARPFILTSQSLTAIIGTVRVAIGRGGTEGGTFAPISTKFCKYLLDGEVAGSTVISAGGSITGGTERDVLMSNAGSILASVGSGAAIGGLRALAAGTYYVNIVCTGTTNGVYSLEWEEL